MQRALACCRSGPLAGELAPSGSRRPASTRPLRGAVLTTSSASSRSWAQPLMPRTSTNMGFQRNEHGLDWYRSKQALLDSGPSPIFVATTYEYEKDMKVQQARKYAAFESHWDYWERITHCNNEGLKHNLHEIFPSHQPRCLYFDLDGPESYRRMHSEIVAWLRLYVRWVFGGDRLGWDESCPEPLVLTNSDHKKYSCHIVFPQLQFRDFEQQQEYMSVILRALPALKVDLEGGEELAILEKVVDRVPYNSFQLFRGPYACKLSQGRLRAETCLEPEGYFRSDPLACFASHVDTGHALAVPPVAQLLADNAELRYYHEEHDRRLEVVTPAGERQFRASPQDVENLYSPEFQKLGGGVLDLAGLTKVEQYEEAMRWLHPARASQWWSWFRISGVASRMLEEHGADAETRQKIWLAHMTWSSTYAAFDEMENRDMVEKGRGERVSGFGMLLQLVRFDNPGVQVRTDIWKHHLHAGNAGNAGNGKAPRNRAEEALENLSTYL